jgi:hypothetical protein
MSYFWLVVLFEGAKDGVQVFRVKSDSKLQTNIFQNVICQIDNQTLREGFLGFVFPLRSSLCGLCVKLRSIFSRKGRNPDRSGKKSRKENAKVYTLNLLIINL